MSSYTVNVDEMQKLVASIFKHAGLFEQGAEDVAEMLIMAEKRGVRSHGILRVPQYLVKITEGGANRNPSFKVETETDTIAVLDADNTLGGAACGQAVRIAREKARNHGIGFVTVKHSNHFGMAGHWSLKLAGDDMVGFTGSTVMRMMPAPGGKVPVIGNNPFSIAASGDKYKEICIDMASCVSAIGKVFDLINQGKPVPMDWMLDENGEYTNDINKFKMAAPLGGHKGYGLAFAVELFACMLSGGALPQEMNNQMDPKTSEMANQFFMAIDISKFRDVAEFKAGLDSYIDFVKASPVKEGVGQAKYPGEIEYGVKQKVLKEGIEVPENVIGDILKACAEAGVPAEEYAFLPNVGDKSGADTGVLNK